MTKLEKHNVFAMILIVIGFLGMLYMIIYEDEPGGIPLIMIGVGIIWYVIAHIRYQSADS